MAESRPIVCTLSASDLKHRARAWHKLMGSGLVERTRVEGGIRLTPALGASQALIQLIELERACCAWIDFEVGAGSAVTLTAEGDGEAVLAGMFVL